NCERAHPEERELDHRRAMARRAVEEEAEERGARDEGADDARRAPAPLRPLDDPERERSDAGAEQHGAERIREDRLRLAALVQEAAGGNERGQPDQQVDVEDRAPALPVDEYSSERRPSRRGDGAGRAPERGRGRAALERELRQEQAE